MTRHKIRRFLYEYSSLSDEYSLTDFILHSNPVVIKQLYCVCVLVLVQLKPISPGALSAKIGSRGGTNVRVVV